MNALLREETQHFLDSFGRRRSTLLLLRACCVFVTVALFQLILVAFLDRSLLLADAIRWTLSGLSWVLSALASWWTSLRLLPGTQSRCDLAQSVKIGDPEFQEELISAVELGDAQSISDAKYDSLELRIQLQAYVAKRVRKLHIRELLPLASLIRPMTGALTMSILLMLLFAIPSWNFSTFFQRAAWPFLNLARPSNIHIEIIRPSPANHFVPRGDDVELVIRTRGARPDRVDVEIIDAAKSISLNEMRRDEMHQFSSTINVDEDLRYRVRADDGITQFFSLTAQSRPSVTRFEKSYHYPAYTQQDDKTIVDATGDLEAIEGTKVHLSLTADQRIAQAELQLESNALASDRTLPMEPVSRS